MAEPKYTIHLAQGDLPKKAVPLVIGEDLRVQSGVGPLDTGARLVGFSRPGSQELAFSAVEGLKEPAQLEGLNPIFGIRGTFFDWGLAVEVIELIEPEPEVDEDQAFIAGELNG